MTSSKALRALHSARSDCTGGTAGRAAAAAAAAGASGAASQQEGLPAGDGCESSSDDASETGVVNSPLTERVMVPPGRAWPVEERVGLGGVGRWAPLLVLPAFGYGYERGGAAHIVGCWWDWRCRRAASLLLLGDWRCVCIVLAGHGDA